MLYNVKIRLATPMLGVQRTAENIRRFRRGAADMTMEFNAPEWAWAFQEASAHLGKSLDVSCLRFPREIPMPRLELFNRVFTTPGGRRKEEIFESIRAGTVLSFGLFTVSRPNAPHRRPRPCDIEASLRFIGEHIGMCTWGAHYQFGRFALESMDQILVIPEHDEKTDADMDGREPAGSGVDTCPGETPDLCGEEAGA